VPVVFGAVLELVVPPDALVAEEPPIEVTTEPPAPVLVAELDPEQPVASSGSVPIAAHKAMCFIFASECEPLL
jgi:hypothetical protein